jgi:hypothetical protein
MIYHLLGGICENTKDGPRNEKEKNKKVEKVCTERDRLWKELQEEVKVSEDGQAALEAREHELEATHVILQELSARALGACDVLLPLPPLGGPLDLVGQMRFFAKCTPWVIRYAVHQGAAVALTLVKLQLPQVNLGAVALGVPEGISDEKLEEAVDAVAPLAVAAVGIVDDPALLVDDLQDEGMAPIGPVVSM